MGDGFIAGMQERIESLSYTVEGYIKACNGLRRKLDAKDAELAALRAEVERLREANSQLKADIVYHVGMNLRLRGLLKEARPWLERQVWPQATDLQDRIDKELEA